MFKAVLLVCALALMVQSIAGRCIGTGLAGPYGRYDGFGPYDGIGAYGAYGYGTYGYGLAGPFRGGCGYGALF